MGSILITGASGHLGGRIARALSQAGYAVTLGLKSGTSSLSLPQIELDLTKAISDQRLEGVETIIHLAALNAQDCEKNPTLAHEVNVRGTMRLVEAAKEARVKRLIYFSTIHVYGTPLEGNLAETAPTRPLSVYARTHLDAEEACLGFQALDRSALCLRLSNSLGAPVQPEVNTWMLLANDLCRQVVREKKIVLKSSGQQLRNFVGVGEVEKFLAKALRQTYSGVVNFGSPQTQSVWQLAQLIGERAQKILGQDIPLQRPAPTPEEFVPIFQFPLVKLNHLGFFPAADLTEEIDGLIHRCQDWFG